MLPFCACDVMTVNGPACVTQVMKCVFLLGHDCFSLVKSQAKWLRPEKVKFEAKQQKTKHNKVPAAVYFSSAQFSSRWYLCAQKTHMRSTTSLRSLPNIAFETVLMFVWLTMALSRPFKEDRLALPLSTPLSSRRSMVWCPWLCACW